MRLALILLLLLAFSGCSSSELTGTNGVKGKPLKAKGEKPERGSDESDGSDASDGDPSGTEFPNTGEDDDRGGGGGDLGSDDSSVTTDPGVSADGLTCASKSEKDQYSEEISGILANVMDPVSMDRGAKSAQPSRQVFSARALTAGDKIFLDHAEGMTLARVYKGTGYGRECNHPDVQWYLMFRDQAGTLMTPPDGKAWQLVEFKKEGGGVVVPEGAASAWLGVRDWSGGVWNGEGSYFDNEGNRSADNSTGGCTFKFRIASVCAGQLLEGDDPDL